MTEKKGEIMSVLMKDEEMIAGVVPKGASLIKKKSYTFTSFTKNCMVTDLNTANSVIIGIRTTNRQGWNLIARNGVDGLVSSDVWVITESTGASLSGTFEVDVCYISI